MSITFYSQPLILISVIMSNSDGFKMNVLETFRTEKLNGIPSTGSKYYSTISCIFLVIVMIMGMGIFYVKRNFTKLSRQNIYTLNSTLFWGFLHFVILILYRSAQIQRDFFACSVLRFVMIFISHFIKYIFVIIDVRKNLPEIMCNNRTFDVNEKNRIVINVSYPRKEPFMPFIPFQQNAR